MQGANISNDAKEIETAAQYISNITSNLLESVENTAVAKAAIDGGSGMHVFVREDNFLNEKKGTVVNGSYMDDSSRYVEGKNGVDTFFIRQPTKQERDKNKNKKQNSNQ